MRDGEAQDSVYIYNLLLSFDLISLKIPQA